MIKDVNLHDATLLAVRVSWEDGTCIADLRHGVLGDCVLTFSKISQLTMPRKHDWGPSVSINSFSQTGSGQYEIEMQSGDLIEIKATDVVLAASGRS